MPIVKEPRDRPTKPTLQRPQKKFFQKETYSDLRKITQKKIFPVLKEKTFASIFPQKTFTYTLNLFQNNNFESPFSRKSKEKKTKKTILPHRVSSNLSLEGGFERSYSENTSCGKKESWEKF